MVTMKNGNNGGNRPRKKAGSFAPAQSIDEFHNHSTPCCALAEQIVKEIFPDAATLVKQSRSTSSQDGANKENLIPPKEEEQKTPPSLLGTMIRSYFLEQRRSEHPQTNPIDAGTKQKRKRKRKKKKANKVTNNGETPSSEAGATTAETATASVPPVNDAAPSTTEQGKTPEEERGTAVVTQQTTEPSPKPTQVDLLLDRILQKNGHTTSSSVAQNRHLSSFVAFLTKRFHQNNHQEREGEGKKSKRKTKAAAAAAAVDPSLLLPTIQIEDVSAACKAISCRACRASAEATCITGGIVQRVGDWSSAPPSMDSIVIRPSTVMTPNKNAAHKTSSEVPVKGRNGLGEDANDDSDIEGAFDYIAVEEGGVMNESDAMAATADAHFRIALRPAFDEDGRKQSLQIRAQLGEDGGPRYPIGVQDIEFLVRHLLLPCGLEAEEEYKLTAEELSAIQERVEAKEEDWGKSFKEHKETILSVQTRLAGADQSAATSFDVKASGDLMDCDKALNELLRKLLTILLSVTQAYHSIVDRGFEKDWAESFIDELWEDYDQTVAALVKGASRHDGRLIQLANRPGADPQMFRSSFRDMLDEKCALLSVLAGNVGTTLSYNEENASCPSHERRPTFVRCLYAYEAFYDTVGKQSNNVDRRQLDESFAALMRAVCELTETVPFANVSDIRCAQEARCPTIWQFSEFVAQTRLEEGSSGTDISDEGQSGSLLRLRQTWGLATSDVFNHWRYMRSLPLDVDADSSYRAPEMPLHLYKWMGFRLEREEWLRNNESNHCQGGCGKRRIACVLTGLLYRWLCDRCMEWHAELTQDELLDAMDEKLVLDNVDINDPVASTGRAGKSGKKFKKKKDRKTAVASVRESAPETIPASMQLEPVQREDEYSEIERSASPRTDKLDLPLSKEGREVVVDLSEIDSESTGSVNSMPHDSSSGSSSLPVLQQKSPKRSDSSSEEDDDMPELVHRGAVAAATVAPSGKTNRRNRNRKKKGSQETEIDQSLKRIIEVITANSGRSSIDRLELLWEKSNAASFKDQNGHTILQLATAAQNADALDWLVKEKGLDPELQDDQGETAFDYAKKKNLNDMQSKLKELQKWSTRKKREEEDRLRKLRADMSVKLQCVARAYLARKELERLREACSDGAWKHLIYGLMDLEISRKRISTYAGKSWTDLKRELDLVVENELDLIGDTALQLEANEEEELEYDGDLEEGEGVTESSQTAPPKKQPEVHSIQLTAEVLRWIRQQKDEKYRELFAKRIEQLARGDRSYCLSKRLKGSKRLVTETKLDKGQRIIWTQRGNDILVWFVCKHKHISRCLELVDLSYERVLSKGDNVEKSEHGGVVNGIAQRDIMNADEEPEMLVNPSSNVPLRIHSLGTAEIENFVQDSAWIPPLKLTAQEEDIVNKDGTVLLLGRSGTGKTLCVVSRIARDSQRLGPDARQLFLARTQRLCNFVSGLVKESRKGEGNVEFKKVSTWIEEIRKHYAEGDEHRWDTKHFIDNRRFCDNIWDSIRGDEKELDALQVWTQIRSFIKGSYEAAKQRCPLEEFQYVQDLSKDRCRLNTGTRQRAYAIFQRYQRRLEEKALWDDMDRTAEVVRLLQEDGSLYQEPLYDRIYVDEVQDITQAEIGLFFLVSGSQPDYLFLAGDPAQAVSQGVDFRFEEVRSAVHMISDGKQKVERWQKLIHNFRSHEGILKVANLVLERLHCAFPNAALKLPRDKGLVLGPRPALLNASFDDVARLVKANERIRVLVRDVGKGEVIEQLSNRDLDATRCFGIVEAKGLEFSDVLIVDFFKSLSDGDLGKAWKQLLIDALPTSSTSGAGRTNPSPAVFSLPQAMELELKLLYTAITRTKDRLLFIETSQSGGFDAWSRCLKGNGLAVTMQTDDVIKEGTKLMTKDDWRVEGIEMASLAESVDRESLSFLERSISYFLKAGDADLAARAQAQLTAVQLEYAANQENLKDSTSSNAMIDGSETVLAYLHAGLLQESVRVCNEMCSSTEFTGLGGRIEKLGRLSNN